MPLTQIDEKSALVVIDLQAGIVGRFGDAATDVVANSAVLAAEFRKAGQTVVLVNVSATPPGRNDVGRGPVEFGDGDIVVDSALGESADDIRVTKRAWGAFTNTGLDAKLRERGVTQVVMTGISTSIGVESTARSAFELGYNVVVVTDAMADSSPASHDHAVSTVFPKLGEVTSTAQIQAKLTGAA
ncbi:isochorismatase family protein [Gordonia humi]|uniref:Nicotinamidase-related amidase n=1 Tax=Gordonia humi TaxID=686429 RepID=A0A840F6G9_9ACTN|nr:isochorismatase family protein [Gordonia humi]MBB4137486.1 nicotinamidase-related amidase [Gordonia humi]